jgi:hypothetical protein
MQALMDVYFEGFRVFMDSAESLDLALHEDGQELALHSVFTVLEGSDLEDWGSAGALPKELPAAIDPQAQFAFLMVADWKDLMGRAQPLAEAFLQAYPAEARAGFDIYWTALNEAYALLGDTAVGSGGFGETGMHFAFYAKAEESAAFVEKLAGAFTAASSMAVPMGVSLGAPQEVEVGGLKARQWPLAIDYEVMTQLAGQAGGAEASAEIGGFLGRLYGEHPTITVAEHSKRVCISFGGAPADLELDFKRLAAGPVPAAPFLAGLRGLPAAPRPLIAYRLNFGELHDALQPMLAAQGVPSEFPDVDLDLTVWFGIEGRRWHGGLGTDMDQLADLAEALDH